MQKCEICGKEGTVHHIVHIAEGGLKKAPINIKYLCEEHHNGKDGPHKNYKVDILYKLELQQKLHKILPNAYYKLEELEKILMINKRILKKILSTLKKYKEGYEKEKIIKIVMGNIVYSEDDLFILEEFNDFIPLKKE